MCRTRLLGLLFCVLACSTIAEGPNYDDEVGLPEPYGVEAVLAEPNGITFTALDFGKHYRRLAVGNVARGVSEPGCRFDYLLGGPTADDIRVVFGGGSNDGLTFLDDRPDEVLPLGGMDDVMLVDLDEDGRNDLLGLRPEAGHEVVVRLGEPMPGLDGPFLGANGVGTPTTVVVQGQGNAVGYGDFASGDLDCDGHVDLAITGPSSNVVVMLLGRGDGSFKTPEWSVVDAKVSHGPVRLLVAQLDGEGGDDIATANNDGSMSVLLANDCTGEFPDPQRYILKPISDFCDNPNFCWDDTDTAVIASGDFCSPPGLDLAYAFEEQIWIVCGTAGNFGEVGEQSHGGSVPGVSAADYFFDLDGPSGHSRNGQIDDTLVWQDELYVLRIPPSWLPFQDSLVLFSHRLVRLTIDPDQVGQGLGEPVLTLYTETPRILLHPAAVNDSTLRLVWPALGMARWEEP